MEARARSGHRGSAAPAPRARSTTPAAGNMRRRSPRCSGAHANARYVWLAFASSRSRVLVIVRVEQPVHVDDEIEHQRIVHGLLSLCLPGRIGGGIVRIDADDVELGKILEFRPVELHQFAAEDEMQEGLGGFGWHFEILALTLSFVRQYHAIHTRIAGPAGHDVHRVRWAEINFGFYLLNASRNTWCRDCPAATSGP